MKEKKDIKKGVVSSRCYTNMFYAPRGPLGAGILKTGEHETQTEEHRAVGLDGIWVLLGNPSRAGRSRSLNCLKRSIGISQAKKGERDSRERAQHWWTREKQRRVCWEL